MIYKGTRHDEFREIVLVIDLRLHGKVPALITLTLFRMGGDTPTSFSLCDFYKQEIAPQIF